MTVLVLLPPSLLPIWLERWKFSFVALGKPGSLVMHTLTAYQVCSCTGHLRRRRTTPNSQKCDRILPVPTLIYLCACRSPEYILHRRLWFDCEEISTTETFTPRAFPPQCCPGSSDICGTSCDWPIRLKARFTHFRITARKTPSCSKYEFLMASGEIRSDSMF